MEGNPPFYELNIFPSHKMNLKYYVKMLLNIMETKTDEKSSSSEALEKHCGIQNCTTQETAFLCSLEAICPQFCVLCRVMQSTEIIDILGALIRSSGQSERERVVANRLFLCDKLRHVITQFVNINTCTIIFY